MLSQSKLVHGQQRLSSQWISFSQLPVESQVPAADSEVGLDEGQPVPCCNPIIGPRAPTASVSNIVGVGARGVCPYLLRMWDRSSRVWYGAFKPPAGSSNVIVVTRQIFGTCSVEMTEGDHEVVGTTQHECRRVQSSIGSY